MNAVEQARALVESIPEGGCLRSGNGSIVICPEGDDRYSWTINGVRAVVKDRDSGRVIEDTIDRKKVVDKLRRLPEAKLASFEIIEPEKAAERAEADQAETDEALEAVGIESSAKRRTASANPENKRKAKKGARANRVMLPNLRIIRQARDLGLWELGQSLPEGLKMTGPSVSRLDTMKGAASPEQAGALAEALGVSLDVLKGEGEIPDAVFENEGDPAAEATEAAHEAAIEDPEEAPIEEARQYSAS